MYGKIKDDFRQVLQQIEDDGLYKKERIIASAQGVEIQLSDGSSAINFCANNYLGFSSDQRVLDAAKDILPGRGFGLSSVRFICGTQDIHRELELKIAKFLGQNDTILYSSCFDANGGLFETVLGEEDAIISDALNHASIIDGIRLCKAKRFRYEHSDMSDLEVQLKAANAANTRYKMIATDGVFSMDGDMAKLDEICSLADKYDALVMVDDSHATGFIGKTGRGTPEHFGVMDRVDVITTTFGKALGGASGGCTSSHKEIVAMLRQKSRPYLFSNSVAPAIVATALDILTNLSETTERRDKLERNTKYFRDQMTAAGFDIKPGVTPIVPIMLYDARLAQEMAAELLKEGIYVIGFSFPVVPRGQARIRTQISAAHETKHLDQAIAAFTKIGKKLGVI
ncbi:MAG: glycine C-acetyltransferase [Deferribacteres bacterium]|nr:glycine C-acetyltransferase [candidate division KSB1 bacterium]MCB9504034.1 glycine C-acetyltransferase [Deferribacteres bacterium]